MDIVITYVNGLDPEWQQDYKDTVGGEILEKRFRDWGTLRYLFRSIECNIPFVRKLHLVVARESQVPEWVNRDKVHVVLHGDIIPEEFLPVFNSTAIEMFLHRIPDLDEQFVYFNDDIFPMRICTPETFFPDGKPVTRMKRMLIFSGNSFQCQVKNSDILARYVAGKGRSLFCVRPPHSWHSLLKSRCLEVYSCAEQKILASITPVRERSNFNIYLFVDYMYHMGLSVKRSASKKHFSLAVAKAERIGEFIRRPHRDFVCINDVQMSDRKFAEMRECILAAFDYAYPASSSYEV